MTSAAVEAGRAFCAVRDAIEASGALTRARGGHSLMASCPLHTDTNPSLSVTWRPRTDSSSGAVLLHCFSCRADAAAIVAGLGLSMADLFDEPPTGNTVRREHKPRPRRTIRPRPKLQLVEHEWQRARVYTYTTAAGRPVQQVIRQECRCGAPNEDRIHKRFVQRYRDHRAGRRWVWKKPADFAPVLYRATALAAAPPDRWVWLVEGEKDAETAVRLGRLATTNAQGAGNFPAELAGELAGRLVAIIIDRDRAGYQRALGLYDQLHHQARRVVFLLPAITSTHADLTDHVDAGLWDSSAPFGGLIETSRADLDDLLSSIDERGTRACSPHR